MKQLTNITVTVSAGKLTLTGDIIDADPNQFRFPARQTTELMLNPNNRNWPRHIQLTHKAIFVKAFGNAFVMTHEDFVKIASAVEPKTTFPPLFRGNAQVGNIGSELCSELKPDLQWQVSDSIGKGANWTNITGQTAGILAQGSAKSGQYVRLVASSEAGSMSSMAVQVK